MPSRYKYDSVLIIDDSAIDRFEMEDKLKRYRIANSTTSFYTADQGLAYLRSFRNNIEALPRLILIDLFVPGSGYSSFLDGYKKLHVSLRKRNIVVLTARCDDPEIVKIKTNQYVIKIMEKPITKTKLKLL